MFNLTELESRNPITTYEEEPTWMETAEAAWTNREAVSTIMSASNYFNREKETELELYKDELTPSSYHIMKNRITRTEIDNYEKMYKDGNIDRIGVTNNGKAFLEFKKIEGTNNRRTNEQLLSDARNKSLEDYRESAKILARSEYGSAEFFGGGASVMTDPFVAMTLPFGGAVATGGTILANAGKAFITEAALETAIQGIERPAVMEYKDELGLKTTIKQEAISAVSNIATAGLFRGVGSATWDLTEAGVKALRAKDPELADEYEGLFKTQATEDGDSHLEALHKTEVGEAPEKIDNPNEKGEALNNADNIPEHPVDEVSKAQESQIFDPDQELKMYAGEDEAGEPIYKSHREQKEELDMNDEYYRRVEECLL